MMLCAGDAIAVLEPEQDCGISRRVEVLGDLPGHDPRIREYFCALMPLGGVVVDGGAYIGDHTVAYAEKVGPRGRVWAFEVWLPALECLFYNTKHLPQVTVVTAALAECEQEVMLMPSFAHRTNLTEGGRMGSCTSVVEVQPHQRGTGLPAMPLDAFCFDRLDLIKLDLEGYELRALRGAEQTIRQHRPIVVTETGSNLERYGDSHAQLVAFMRDLGYTGERLPLEHSHWTVFDMVFRPACLM